MPVPTAYTEATLRSYMHDTLGATATVLGWSMDSTYYDEAVVEAVLAYGETDIADCTDMRKLRALARREVWRIVMNETSMDYDRTADGASLKRSQTYDHAEKQFDRAQSDCMALGLDGYEVVIESTEYNDPYKPYEDDSA